MGLSTMIGMRSLTLKPKVSVENIRSILDYCSNICVTAGVPTNIFSPEALRLRECLYLGGGIFHHTYAFSICDGLNFNLEKLSPLTLERLNEKMNGNRSSEAI